MFYRRRCCRGRGCARNNGYAISTPAADQYSGNDMEAHAAGNVANFVASAKARNVASALKSKWSVLLEAMTYLSAHHNTSDDSYEGRRGVAPRGENKGCHE